MWDRFQFWPGLGVFQRVVDPRPVLSSMSRVNMLYG